MIREGSIRIPFAYAAGGAGSRFLVALRDEGRILGSPCPTCGRVLCPARSFCARCGEDTGEPIEVGPAGTLVSFTEQAGGRCLGLILLDGADTAMLHLLLAEGTRWILGARVRARFATERTGQITDIEGFEPCGEEGGSR